MTIDHLKNKERAFLLTLDPANGQDIAAKSGFVPPSESVGEVEMRGVMKDWAKLQALGVFDTLEMYTDWYMEMVSSVLETDLPEIYKLQHRASLMTFFAASLISMHRDGMVVVSDLDKIEVTEYRIDPDTNELESAPDEYSDIMKEYEHLMRPARLVEEPAQQEDKDEQ